MMIRKLFVGLATIAMFALIAAACSGGLTGPTASPEPSQTATSVPASTPDASPSPTPTLEATDPVEKGRQLFAAKGCAVCHGADARGTAIAPALPGHSSSIVKRQARAPLGTMPVFPPDKISNSELDLLAQFIASLPGGHAHERPADTGQQVALHHWMALLTLEEDDPREAAHHVEHIIELVEGPHLVRMQEILKLLQEGQLHDAAHGIQDMLAGTADLGLTPENMHLQMALSGLRVEDVEGASHHLAHFLETADGQQILEAQLILDALHELDFLKAEHELEDLLGIGHEEATDHDAEEATNHEHDGETDENGHNE